MVSLTRQIRISPWGGERSAYSGPLILRCQRPRPDADLPHIPIVVVTPFDDAGSRHELVAAGATRIVSASWSTTRGMVSCAERQVRSGRRQRPDAPPVWF